MLLDSQGRPLPRPGAGFQPSVPTTPSDPEGWTSAIGFFIPVEPCFEDE